MLQTICYIKLLFRCKISKYYYICGWKLEIVRDNFRIVIIWEREEMYRKCLGKWENCKKIKWMLNYIYYKEVILPQFLQNYKETKQSFRHLIILCKQKLALKSQ